jgi:hypothetical protein
MKMHFLLVGIVGTGLLILTPDAVAHGGAGGGTGHGGGPSAGHGGGAWGGHGHGAWAGRGGGSWTRHGDGAWAGRQGGAWAGHGHGAWAGHRGGAWAGHGRVAWGGHGHGFHHGGRFFGPGFGFFGYNYPWYYPGYSDYPYSAPYDGDPYFDSGYYGNTYYGIQDNENPDPRSSATKSLQNALARRGYYRGPIDGVFGPETSNAIRSFQTHQGLPVTGRPDSSLMRALQS